jgi:hypothetical protein
MTIREFSNAEYYNPDSDSYNRNNNNRGKGLTYCSIFALSKTIEIIHAVTAKETISSGEVIDEYIIPGPLFTLDEKGHPYFGAAVTLKF